MRNQPTRPLSEREVLIAGLVAVALALVLFSWLG